MSHRLTLPFLTEDPGNLEANRVIFVSRIALADGVLHMQGRPVGSKAKPLSWPARDIDIANMFYAYTVGYRGQLHLPGLQNVWTELAAKIARERSKTHG